MIGFECCFSTQPDFVGSTGFPTKGIVVLNVIRWKFTVFKEMKASIFVVFFSLTVFEFLFSNEGIFNLNI